MRTTRTTCGPNGLALTIVMIGIVRASCTMALNSRTSEGSISGRTLTITEQRVKNIPETAARKIPRRTDEGLLCNVIFVRISSGWMKASTLPIILLRLSYFGAPSVLSSSESDPPDRRAVRLCRLRRLDPPLPSSRIEYHWPAIAAICFSTFQHEAKHLINSIQKLIGIKLKCIQCPRRSNCTPMLLML